jgi:SEC-C motif-containing protein
MSDCPCGSEHAFAKCCEPYITGKAKPRRAEQLMRARYTSYATGAIDFVEKTQIPEVGFDRASSEKWSKESEWKGLEIVGLKKGGENDDTGNVGFIAYYRQGGEDREHHEIALFEKRGGEWLFVDGKPPSPETHKNAEKAPGRNDPCHCGSGKKFKKCHGK